MARIIDTSKELEIICPHCLKKIGFTIEDIWASVNRGLEYSEGWPDPEHVWTYIRCPNCEKIIDVSKVIPDISLNKK